MNFLAWAASKALEAQTDPFTTQPEVYRACVPHAENLILPEHLGMILDRPESYSHTLCVMSGMRFVPQQTFRSREHLASFVQSTDATVAYSAVQRSLSAVKLLCEVLEGWTGNIPTFGTVYQTPAGTQGFQVHWDLGSVVVMQLKGMKRWTVQAPIVSSIAEIKGRNPHLSDEEVALSPVVLHATLEPGDALFIPRGAPHFAEAVGDVPSLHLSLGLLHPDIDLNQVTVYP